MATTTPDAGRNQKGGPKAPPGPTPTDENAGSHPGASQKGKREEPHQEAPPGPTPTSENAGSKPAKPHA